MIVDYCFTNDFIESRAGTNIERKKIYEKVVFAFYLLESLKLNEFVFIFKGGTSLMLLLDDFDRFSVDVDILMAKGKEYDVRNLILEMKTNRFSKVEEDIRTPVDIIKKHFKFFYNSIYQDIESYVLLDIVFEDYKYNYLQEKTIESHFVKTTNPLLSVLVPSIDEMLGDKLTAFAPRTIGILFSRPNQFRSKHVEIVKQLYDVSKLSTKYHDLHEVKKAYIEVAQIQMRNRKLNLKFEECLKDSLMVCKLILSEGKFGGTSDEYVLLKKGYEGFENYVVSKLYYKDFLIMAARVYILCVKLLYGFELINEERPINTFVGKSWKYIRQNLGEKLYCELMQACFEENQIETLITIV